MRMLTSVMAVAVNALMQAFQPSSNHRHCRPYRAGELRSQSCTVARPFDRDVLCVAFPPQRRLRIDDVQAACQHVC